MDDTTTAAPQPAARPSSLRTRLRAAGLRLAISAVVVLAALYLLAGHWFPDFHFSVDGGRQGLLLLAAADFVLGPLLTFVVFDPFKARRLIVFDLVCIGLVQAAALAAGLWTAHGQRPVALSFRDDAFHGVVAAPLRLEQYPLERLRALSDRRPALVYSRPARNDDEAARLVLQELTGSMAAHEDPHFFEPLAPRWDTVAAQGRAEGDRVVLPYRGRYGDCELAFTRDGRLLGAQGCRRR